MSSAGLVADLKDGVVARERYTLCESDPVDAGAMRE